MLTISSKKTSKSKFSNWKECPTRKEFEQHLFSVFVEHYGLTCTCDDGIDIDFRQAASHYQRCAYWKFCHAVNRSLDWSEHIKSKKESYPQLTALRDELKNHPLVDKINFK